MQHFSVKRRLETLARPWRILSLMVVLFAAIGMLSACSSGSMDMDSLTSFWASDSDSTPSAPSAPKTHTQQGQAQQSVAQAGGSAGGGGAMQQGAAKSPSAIKVAILVPLTGPNAALGQAMVDAAQLAVFDLAPQNFELMPRDTGDTTEQAVAAARDVLANGASLILGPLFSASVTAVKPYALEAGVNLLAFSNDASLAGGGVYVLGFTPAAQVERIVSYAKSQGYHNLAAFIPDGPYGVTINQSLVSAASMDGFVLAGAPHYNVSTGQMRDNLEEAVKELPPTQDYDSLLLPEGGKRLMALAEQVAAHNSNIGPNHGQVRLLGTGLWDEPGLGQDSVLVGGWYAAPDPNSRKNFEKHFADTYGHEPPRLATLSYDATALAAVISKNGWGINPRTLTNPNGFTGADGLFRLSPNGLAERGLAVLEVTSDGSKVVDPAPRSFAPLTVVTTPPPAAH